MSTKILVLAGSTRINSINIQLAHALTNALLKKGADTTHILLKDYELPLFNDDIDVPENAVALSQLVAQCDGMVVVSPEYNASLTPLLKNAIDWVSITKNENGSGFGPYKDKMCFLAACSPGATGGLRGLYHLRAVLMNVGAEIITPQLAVGNAATAFDEDGNLAEQRMIHLMNKGLEELLFSIKRIKAVPRV